MMSESRSRLAESTLSINSMPLESSTSTAAAEVGGPTSTSSLRSLDLVVITILFITDAVLETLLILQWLHDRYTLPLLVFLVCVALSNATNTVQWYMCRGYTTFKWCHTVVLFGMCGVLPLLSLSYYMCAALNLVHIDPVSDVTRKKRWSSYMRAKSHNNDGSQLLLGSDTSPISRTAVQSQMLSNCLQLFLTQAIFRSLAFVCIALYVWVACMVHSASAASWLVEVEEHLLDTSWHDTRYVWSIAIALLTYAVIAVRSMSVIESTTHNWSFWLDLWNVLFVMCDCVYRVVPLFLALHCESVHVIAIVFGLEIMWCLEVTAWCEAYAWFPSFPMRKVYPATYNKAYTLADENESDGRQDISAPPSPVAMRPKTESSQLLTTVSSSPQGKSRFGSTSSSITLVPDTDVTAPWGLSYHEFVALYQEVIGGTLGCVSGWLIGYSMRRAVGREKQHRICVLEITARYLLSIVLVAVYFYEYDIFTYEEVHIKYRVWPLVVAMCLLCAVPFIVMLLCRRTS